MKYEELDQYQKKIVDELRKFKGISKLNRNVYYHLRTKAPFLLDIAFANTERRKVDYNKELLINMAKNGEPRPSSKTKLGDRFFNYLRKDEEFKREIIKSNPTWLNTRIDSSYKKMLLLIPSFVKFKEGQKWKGTHFKYSFICNNYGEFISKPMALMNKPWKNGLSGHPKMGRDRVTYNKKRIININNNIIYDSITVAALEYEINKSALVNALKKNTPCCGCLWAYVEE